MNNSEAIKKSILFVHLQGGLGNQLFIYSAAKYYEKNYGRKIIFVSESIDNLIALGIDIHKNKIVMPKLVCRILVHFFAKISQNKTFGKYFYFSRNIGYEDISKRIDKIRFLSGYFQSFHYILNYDSTSTLINQSFQKLLRQKDLLEQIDFKDSIAIHIRRGDYLLDKNKYFGLLSVEYYRKSLDKMHTLKSFSNVYLFSDSKITEDFKNKLNFDEKFRLIDSSYLPELDDITTIALLTKFSACIISNSTFSWWGAYLGEDKKIVLAPSKWFKSKPDPSLLYPTDWLVSESFWEE